jgi:hypothetical protein
LFLVWPGRSCFHVLVRRRRVWRTKIRRALKDEYVAYVKATGIDGYKETPGNLGATATTRDIDAARAEIVTLSWWKDEATFRAVAGNDISCARYYPEDEPRPETVQHDDSTAP